MGNHCSVQFLSLSLFLARAGIVSLFGYTKRVFILCFFFLINPLPIIFHLDEREYSCFGFQNTDGRYIEIKSQEVGHVGVVWWFE